MNPRVLLRPVISSASRLGVCLGLAAQLAIAGAIPATPPARAWHGFTSDGAVFPAQSRLFLYGGAGSEMKPLGDLWYYMVYTGNWTLVVPSSRAGPGPRQWHGWSCGGGACLLANGSNGVGLVAESWLYTQDTNAWTQVSCRRSTCPSARQMVTTAYDPAGVHVLFGGRGTNMGFDDTWTFDSRTMAWNLQARRLGWPSERNRAGAVFVPGAGIVLHGGQVFNGSAVLCDVYAWRNGSWTRIDSAGAPCLHSHSMAWDDGNRLVVTGGYVDTNDTRNSVTYYLPFTNGVAGQWSTDPDLSGCVASVHPGARMAFDLPTRKKVFYGGESNIGARVVRYGDTTGCD